ncbi:MULTISPECIES: hypothetical protein [unclassified Brevibacterium]|uniref:hypothetical protein n=1 Tax=unclassified Brevibacterium TaxID=2614124 RepID=UPI0010929B11|nr:hypothetical protein [Brevibacterium sp. S22]TGD29137.1 hypothetical protein EB835_16515 [Brevibacterium sp. S22]
MPDRIAATAVADDATADRRPAWSWAAFCGGILGANSCPHLLVAARRGHMLTPLGGKDSGPAANLIWGLMNVTAASVAVLSAVRSADQPSRLTWPFALGSATFGAWAVIYETISSKRGGAHNDG